MIKVNDVYNKPDKMDLLRSTDTSRPVTDN